MNVISNKITQISDICRQHNVRSLFAFGSVTNEKFSAKSDIDFVVDIDASNPLEYADHYFELKDSLTELLQREIDLLEKKAIRNPVLKREIDKTKVLVYGRE